MQLTSRGSSGFTLIEIVMIMTLIGILAAIAIPNFIKMQSRSKQAEARANLKAFFVAEKGYFANADTYSNLISIIAFAPERDNRYCYDVGGGASPVWQSRTTSVTGTDTVPPTQTSIMADTFKYASVGITSVMTSTVTATVTSGQNGTFIASAVSNLDGDPTLDQWSISSYNRNSAVASSTTQCSVGNNPEGEPRNDINDVAE